MLEESDEVPQRLLDIILGCLLAPKKDDKPAAYKCAPRHSACHAHARVACEWRLRDTCASGGRVEVLYTEAHDWRTK